MTLQISVLRFPRPILWRKELFREFDSKNGKWGINETPVVDGDIIYVPVVEKVRIFVTGAVRTPNLYEVPRSEPITVLKAITLAGGTTDRAAQKKVQVMRTDSMGQRISFIVNLEKIKRGKEEDPILREDDIVLVPEAFF